MTVRTTSASEITVHGLGYQLTVTIEPDAAQLFEVLGDMLSFDELVIDYALSPVRVEIGRSGKKTASLPNDDLLTALQCEV